MGERLIANTGTHARHPWPPDVRVQGGALGVVMSHRGSYRTAFVEAFPGTFLRGEGATIADAEDACWRQYQRWLNCDGTGPHGPPERRGYTNGGAFCSRCGVWLGCVLDEIPADGERHLLMRALVDHDPAAVAEIVATMATADQLPTRQRTPATHPGPKDTDPGEGNGA